MEKLAFKALINAPRNKVWNILWGDATYPVWTAPFAEGSRVETSWEVGSRVRFLDGNNRGMVSVIANKIPNEFMSFQHLGDINNGVEDLTSDKVKEWAGAHENYTLTDVDGKTELLVEMDMNEAFKSYFLDTWPKAVDKIKELAEAH